VSPSPIPDRELHLIKLLDEVNRARAAFRALRDRPSDSGARLEQQQLAADLVDAMRAYADAASASGVPLPNRYRDEMRLYRTMTENERYRPR